MVLPDGFVLPPFVHTAVLAFAGVAVSVLLWTFRPHVRGWTVIAFAPWMVVGSAFHVLERIDAIDPLLEPLFAAPAVYVTTYALLGTVWLTATILQQGGLVRSADRLLGIVGGGFAFVFCVFVFLQGYWADTLAPFWPVMGVVITGIVTAAVLVPFSLRYTDAMATTGKAGGLVVFGHALDGVSTAIGIDILGVAERSPLPRAIMDFAATLPTAEYLGEGWLFVLVKLLLAAAMVGLLAEYVRDKPNQGNLLLAAVAAVGLGPGTHNLLLFLVTG